ncbi:Tat pathway signal sequence domain protein [Trichuris suis]|nr:Tat pathway signal sequence domain protein [Trichuris suis]
MRIVQLQPPELKVNRRRSMQFLLVTAATILFSMVIHDTEAAAIGKAQAKIICRAERVCALKRSAWKKSQKKEHFKAFKVCMDQCVEGERVHYV